MEVEVLDFLEQDVASGSDDLIVVVVQHQWKALLLLELPVQIPLEVGDLRLKTTHRFQKNVGVAFHEVTDVDVVTATLLLDYLNLSPDKILPILQ